MPTTAPPPILFNLPESLTGTVRDLESVRYLATLNRLIVAEPTVFQEGLPVVSRYFAIQDQKLTTKQWVLQVAGSLARSQPYADMQALARSVTEAGLPLRELEIDQEEGVLIGRLDRNWYVLGDEHALQAQGVELGVSSQKLARQMEEAGSRILFLGQKQRKELLAIFAVSTPFSLSAGPTVRQLEELGLEITLLTEQKTRVAKGVGQELGISLVHSELTPKEKEHIIISLQGGSRELGVLCDPQSFLQIPESSFAILVGKRPVASAAVLLSGLAQLPELIQWARAYRPVRGRHFFWQRT